MNLIKSIEKYFFSIFGIFYKKLKNSYFKTNIYNKKISKNIPLRYVYKPSPHIINCLISFNKKKIKIDNFYLNSIWNIDSSNKIEFDNLHNFFWLNSLDVKTSKIATQNIIENWIVNNFFNENTWKLETLSKRLIAWISNTNLTLSNSNPDYKKKFILSVTRQGNHLYKNINNEKNDRSKIIGCAALIQLGLVFEENKKFYYFGLDLIKKIFKINFNNENFPYSRNIEELNEYFKYFIIIREWIKESQNPIPDFLDIIIYNLGSSFHFINENTDKLPLFNGSSELQNSNFKKYLTLLGYSFKFNSNNKSGYLIFKNKKIFFIMDIGNSADSKFSKNYQCGSLSFELSSGNQKLICNSGFYSKKNNILNNICKSTAAHTALYLGDRSSCVLNKNDIKEGLKVISKKIDNTKEFDLINASHNGYLKRFGYIHQREIKFLKKESMFIGQDKLIKNKKSKKTNFVVRFHIYPKVKIVKTQNSKTILLSMQNGDGWSFNCQNFQISIEKGIFLGNKNKIIENENIFISGNTQGKDLTIEWSFKKIS